MLVRCEVLAVCVALTVGGFAGAQERPALEGPRAGGGDGAERPVLAPPPMSKLAAAAAGSNPMVARRTVASASFFSVAPQEPKVLKKHDFITVIVREESDITSDGKSDLSKSTDFDAHLDQMIKLKLKNYGIEGGAQGATPPAIKFGGSRDFKGDAKMETKDSFTMRITAEVVDVKPNGTVAIQARKRIKHDEEEQEYLMTGYCRSVDLTPDNTIVSSQIHDLMIETTHRGAVKDTTSRGWVPKLLDFVNPF